MEYNELKSLTNELWKEYSDILSGEVIPNITYDGEVLIGKWAGRTKILLTPFDEYVSKFNALQYINCHQYTDKFYYSSPIEADDVYQEGGSLFAMSYQPTKLPPFMLLNLVILLHTGKVLNDFETGCIYTLLYTEPSTITKLDDSYLRRDIQLGSETFNVKIYKKLPEINTEGHKLGYTNNKYFNDRFIHFNDKFKPLDIIYNQVTLQHLLCRLHKVDGSLKRDLFAPLMLKHCGGNPFYSYKADLDGYDLTLNTYKFRSRTHTKRGEDLADLKAEVRHIDLNPNACIDIHTHISGWSKDKYILMPEKLANTILTDIANGSIDSSYFY